MESKVYNCGARLEAVSVAAAGTGRRMEPGADRQPQTRVGQGRLELSTSICLDLESGGAGSAIKYNMLWFFLDLYHRQGYFFICGTRAVPELLYPGASDFERHFSQENASFHDFRKAMVTLEPF
jgi:hypothetical protein